VAKLFADYLKEADENPAAIIMSVAELMRKDMDADNEVAKTSIPFFLMQLRNAGLPISYAGLKAYYNAHPELKNVIQTFNDEEIIFVGQGDEADGETLGEPQGDIPPEEVVDNMAKRAMNKRMNEEEVELDEARVPKDDLNWVATGGEFGKKRRFPGYIIKKEGIKYNAYDEDDMDRRAGAMSLEGLARMLKPYIDRRIGGGWELSKALGLDDTMIEGKDQGASKEEEDEFHVALDDLVHKTFGHSSMEKKKKPAREERMSQEEFDYWQSPESLAKLAGIAEAKADPKIVAKFARVPGSQRSYYIMKWAEENGIDGNEAMELAGYEKGSYMGYGTYNWRYVGESDISERKLTGGEKRSREANVKKLKKHKGDFEKRYGKDAESVMYAVATKRAKGD